MKDEPRIKALKKRLQYVDDIATGKVLCMVSCDEKLKVIHKEMQMIGRLILGAERW